MLNYISNNGCSEPELEFLLFRADCKIVKWKYFNIPKYIQILFQCGSDKSFYKILPTESQYFNVIRNNFIEDTN